MNNDKIIDVEFDKLTKFVQKCIYEEINDFAIEEMFGESGEEISDGTIEVMNSYIVKFEYNNEINFDETEIENNIDNTNIKIISVEDYSLDELFNKANLKFYSSGNNSIYFTMNDKNYRVSNHDQTTQYYEGQESIDVDVRVDDGIDNLYNGINEIINKKDTNKENQ